MRQQVGMPHGTIVCKLDITGRLFTCCISTMLVCVCVCVQWNLYTADTILSLGTGAGIEHLHVVFCMWCFAGVYMIGLTRLSRET